MEKDTERGDFYQMRIAFTHYDFWSWKEIVSVIREDRKHPELICLHFGRGKALGFSKADANRLWYWLKEIPELADADPRQILATRKEIVNNMSWKIYIYTYGFPR